MATERLSMRNTREVLRQKWELKKSHREVARSLSISIGGVARVVERATVAALTWEEVQGLDEESLEKALFGERPPASAPQRPLPDPVYIHTERRRPGVTLELLHQEYLEKHPDGYRYTQFCEHYRRWLDEHRLSMRQVHVAGEKAFLDYSGNKPRLVEQTTGVVTEAELFIAVLGASNYTFAEATRTQSSPDWISSNIHALEYFGGVPRALIPDQLRTGVTQPCRYEPGVQRTYAELARHYETVVIPARPGKPRDKAKVEVGVLIAQRWILARLRHETIFTLERLNERIAELVEELNGRQMRLYGASRREMFERLEKPVLRKLPERRFEYADWKRVGIGIDYHVEVEHHFYSVPHALRPEKSLEARFTATTIELFLRGNRVASHVRSYQRGGHTTVGEHMPKAHQKHMDWSPMRILHWAESIGPNTQALAQAILAERPHPEMGYRSCLGILRLAKQYGNERLEAASGRALAVGARSYRHVAEGGPEAGPRSRRPREAAHVGARAAAAARERARSRLLPLSMASPLGLETPRGKRRGEGRKSAPLPPSAPLPRGPHPNRANEEKNVLNEPTVEKLKALKLTVMAAAWEEQQKNPAHANLAFDERLSLLVDAEWTARESARLARNLQEAKLRISGACVEDIDYSAKRELEKGLIRQLATCRWIEEHQNVVITGAAGTGKTYVACALAQQACRRGFRAIYRRAPRLFEEIALADGTYARMLTRFAKIDVLVLDDWGLAAPTETERRELLEVLEDRYATRSVVMTSQLPTAKWHDALGDPTIADAVCDRILHNAHRIVLKGPSRRKEATPE